MRSVANLTISFGLISIPVKTYLAASSESFSFRMITPTGNTVKQKLVDEITGKDVERGDCLKGYEYEKGKFITFSEQDIDDLAGEKSGLIEIVEFVDSSYFDPITVEKSYYLAPDKGGDRSYQLLSSTLDDLGKMAVGKYYSRGKDHLVVLKPNGANRALTMFQMYYPNEVRNHPYNFSDSTRPSEQEVELAKELINKLSFKTFDSKKYNDEFAERLRVEIESRLTSGKKGKSVGKKSVPVNDILTLLQASLKGAPPTPVELLKKPSVRKVKIKK